METMLTSSTGFYFWWMLVNGLRYYAEIDFVLRFTDQKERRHILPYIVINCGLTVLAIYMNLFSFTMLSQIAVLFLYASALLKLTPARIFAPAVILFTLSTLIEGLSTVFLRFLSLSLRSLEWGLALQVITSGVFAVLFLVILRLIARRYRLTYQTSISPYLSILMLPCALMVWAVRMGLGLDSETGILSHGALVTGEISSALSAGLWMLAAFASFLVIIEVFYKVVTLSEQELEKALLADQVKEQRSYIAEARQRNEGYRSYQHDIDNHLLVLSGLIGTKEYEKAERYLEKLHLASRELATEISTGNSVLDVLLREKIRYGEQHGIQVAWDVQMPGESGIDEIDLCILFSNGLDNAIQACRAAPEENRRITLTAKRKAQFLLIDVVNSTDPSSAPIVYGTGLKNMKRTAEKYGGTLCTEKREAEFRLSILLCSAVDEGRTTVHG